MRQLTCRRRRSCRRIRIFFHLFLACLAS